MAYRDEIGALEARVSALNAEVAERARERDEVARMLEEARARERANAYVADLEAGGPARRRRKRLRVAAWSAAIAMIVGGLVAYLARPHHDDRFEDAMHELSRFTDQMCACKDSACAQHVSDAMTTWGTAMAKDWTPEPKLTDEQIKRATAVAERMGQCMTKAMTASELAQ